jgi:hypothetical protein
MVRIFSLGYAQIVALLRSLRLQNPAELCRSYTIGNMADEKFHSAAELGRCDGFAHDERCYDVDDRQAAVARFSSCVGTRHFVRAQREN